MNCEDFEKHLTFNLNTFNNESQKLKIKINVNKLKNMIISREENTK